MISVIVPVYNSIKFLPTCFETLLDQTYKDLEIIFVDDCSTDGSAEYIEKNMNKFLNCKLIKNNERQLPFLSRLHGFRAANGDYCICLDCDDYVDTTYYENLLNEIKASGADMCVGDVTLENDRAYRINSKFFERPEKNYDVGENWLNFMCFSGKNKFNSICNKLVSRQVLNNALNELKDIGDWAKISNMDDFIMLMIFSFYTKKLVYVEKAKYHYVMHSEQSTKFNSADKIKMQLKSFVFGYNVVEKFLKTKNLKEKYNIRIRKGIRTSFKHIRAVAILNHYDNDEDVKSLLNLEFFKPEIFYQH